MNTALKLVFLAIALSNMVGCATITTDANQMIQITTEDKANTPIKDVDCVLRNERGTWKLNNKDASQGATQVHKSADNLLVTCSKEGIEDGEGTLISRTNAGMWGNVLIGGGIGAIIDHNKGTAYTYPSWIKIIMGESLVFDRSDQENDQMVTGKHLTAEQLEETEKEKEALEKAEKEKAEKEALEKAEKENTQAENAG